MAGPGLLGDERTMSDYRNRITKKNAKIPYQKIKKKYSVIPYLLIFVAKSGLDSFKNNKFGGRILAFLSFLSYCVPLVLLVSTFRLLLQVCPSHMLLP